MGDNFSNDNESIKATWNITFSVFLKFLGKYIINYIGFYIVVLIILVPILAKTAQEHEIIIVRLHGFIISILAFVFTLKSLLNSEYKDFRVTVIKK